MNSDDLQKKTKKCPKIAIYIGSLQMGGSERHVIRLLEGLPNHGYRVTLIVNSKSGALLEQATNLGVEVIEIPISPTLVGRLGFVLNVAQLLRNHHFDIVQGYNDISILYIGLAAKIAGTRHLIFALQNTHLLDNLSIKTKIIGWVCRNLIQGAIVNSHQTAQQMTNVIRVPAKRIKIAYGGVQFLQDRQPNDAVQMREKLGIHATRKTIGIVARLDPVKRVDTLIKIAILLSDLPIQFVVVGDGEERANLQALVESTGQSDRFFFAGNQKEPFPWISGFDIGVLCSDSEGLPQAILEYMAVGLPVVAPAVGGISELVVEGKTGFIVSPNDLPAFATALRCLIGDQKLSEQMGMAGQKRAREFFTLEKEILAHIYAYQSW